MSEPQIGIVGTIEFNGQKYDFTHLVSDLGDLCTFPASEGPRSIVTGSDEEQKAKYIATYAKTDEYVNNLLVENIQKGKALSSQQQLTQLTTCLHKTRQETDHVLTMVMNGDFPTKRARQQPANAFVEDEIEHLSEEVKRQRALDTTEYFSASEDESDEQQGKTEMGE